MYLAAPLRTGIIQQRGGTVMRNKIVFGLAGCALLVTLVGAGIHVNDLNRKLENARIELLTAQHQITALKSNFGASEKRVAEYRAERAKLSENFDNSVAANAELAEAKKIISHLEQEVNATSDDLAYAEKISGYWRDLFDYTKALRASKAKPSSTCDSPKSARIDTAA